MPAINRCWQKTAEFDKPGDKSGRSAVRPCAALLSNVHGHCACSQFILITSSSVRVVNIRQVGRDGVTCGSGASASGRVVACRPCPGVSPVAGRLEGGLPGGSTACPPPVRILGGRVLTKQAPGMRIPRGHFLCTNARCRFRLQHWLPLEGKLSRKRLMRWHLVAAVRLWRRRAWRPAAFMIRLWQWRAR